LRAICREVAAARPAGTVPGRLSLAELETLYPRYRGLLLSPARRREGEPACELSPRKPTPHPIRRSPHDFAVSAAESAGRAAPFGRRSPPRVAQSLHSRTASGGAGGPRKIAENSDGLGRGSGRPVARAPAGSGGPPGSGDTACKSLRRLVEFCRVWGF
jgi:hypothetical protein